MLREDRLIAETGQHLLSACGPSTGLRSSWPPASARSLISRSRTLVSG